MARQMLLQTRTGPSRKHVAAVFVLVTTMFSSNSPIASSSSIPHTPTGNSQRRHPSSNGNTTSLSPKKLASVSSTHLHPSSPSPNHQIPRRSRSSTTISSQPDTATWGSNFWVCLHWFIDYNCISGTDTVGKVTLSDPQVRTQSLQQR